MADARVAMHAVSTMPSSHTGKPPTRSTSPAPCIGRRYPALRSAKGSVDADTTTSFSKNATAEQCDACSPSVSTVHVVPPSRLMHNPVAAAATTISGSLGCAHTSCTSLCTSMVGCQLIPPSRERAIPPTCTFTNNAAPSAVPVIERTPSGGPTRSPLISAEPAYHVSRPGAMSKPVSAFIVPSPFTRSTRASSVPT